MAADKPETPRANMNLIARIIQRKGMVFSDIFSPGTTGVLVMAQSSCVALLVDANLDENFCWILLTEQRLTIVNIYSTRQFH